MALKLLAVDGLTLAHGAGSPVTGGSFTITSIPSTKVLTGGVGVYSGPLSFTFSGGSVSGGVPGTAQGSGSISATSVKAIVEGSPPLRESDSGTMSGQYEQTNPAPPPPTITVPFSGAPVEISVAGQIKVSSE